MAIRTEPIVAIGVRTRPRPRVAEQWIDRGSVFSWLMMTPPVLFLAALVGYPFCLRHLC